MLNGEMEKTKCVFLLGGFDGLHIGHKSLIERAKTFRLPVVLMTIDGIKGGSLFTVEERESAFMRAGIDRVALFDFAQIRDLDYRAFADLITSRFDVAAFVCGEDFRFGRDAEGTPALLEKHTGIPVHAEPLLKINGAKVSSTKLKAYLLIGDMPRANAMLCEPYFIRGEVIKDRGIGKTLGFPTANIPYPDGKFELRKGVYHTEVTVDGKTYRGITNFGARPTFGEDATTTETYLDGFAGDLYGQVVEVRFLRYLRGIKRFLSENELKKQLEHDLWRVKNG
jgi:riboflavin kinase/FMN adenylyltransferase